METNEKQTCGAGPTRTLITSRVDYRKLSNEQLHSLLCALIPDMVSLPVTWETRETAIRMLLVTEKM